MLRKLLQRFPRLKAVLRYAAERALPSRFVSSRYHAIEPDQVEAETARLSASWQAGELPRRQRELVDRQLMEYRQGKSIDVFDVMVTALKSLGPQQRSLLEVGCSSGFYSEVLQIKQLPFNYSGCDYSPAFIELAHAHYPDRPFFVADATALQAQAGDYDVVVSGCCLQHIPDYAKAIAESARVAREYVVFHRTPIVSSRSTQYFRKQAHGVETIEIHFNEEELLELFKRHGLEVVHTYTLWSELDPIAPGAWRHNRTYLCKKN